MRLPSDKQKFKCVYIVCIVILFVYVRPSWTQNEQNTYQELLKKVIIESPIKRTGVFSFLAPSSGWYPPGPQFAPIRGLGDPNAVPFLINILRNGPDWSDEGLPEGKGDMYRYVARCYAALCLGSTGDSRAFEPLLEILNNTALEPYKYGVSTTRSGEYNLRAHAAFAIGYLGDRRAIEPLIKTLKQDGFIECIYALARLRAVEAVPTIITTASERNLFNLDAHQCLEYILRVRIKVQRESKKVYKVVQFPEAGTTNYPEIHRVLWQHWMKVGDKYAKDQFEEYYPQWKAALKDKPTARSLHRSLLRKMLKGGVAAMPYMMTKIEQGDNDLVQAVSSLTDEHQMKNYPAEKCLQWWNNHKQKWLIFEPNKQNPGGRFSPR